MARRDYPRSVKSMDRTGRDEETSQERPRPRARPGALARVLWFIYEMLRGVVGIALTLGIIGGGVAVIAMALLGGPPKQVMVPRLQGLTVAEAEKRLADEGLKLRVAGREYDTEAPEDTIARTEPHAGKRVKTGRVVQVVISLGPRTVVTPKVTGLTLVAAERRLHDAGLLVEEIRRQTSEVERDIVLEQHPAAGAQVGRQEGVVLVASGGEKFGMIEAPDGPPWVFKRLRLIVPKAPPLQRVQVLLKEGAAEERSVYDRVHKPGDEVRVNLVARKGWRVRARIVDEQVFEQEL